MTGAPDASLVRAGLSRARAEAVARRICGADTVLVRCEAAPIEHRVIRETTGALFRVRLHVAAAGDAVTGRTHAYDVVVKRMQAESGVVDAHRAKFLPSRVVDHPNYWLREYEAYGSTLLRNLPAPLRIPICYGRDCNANVATVWLEAVAADAPATWTDERFAAVARAFGTWQGADAANPDPAREIAWLARGALRTWAPAAGGSAHAAAMRETERATPLARATFGSTGLARLASLWVERDAALAFLDGTRQTLAHGDLWTRNLLATSDAESDVVVIDWSELGVAPVAHDLVNLVLDSTWMLDVPAARLPAIQRVALRAFTEGWRVAGGPNAARIEPAFRAGARVRFGALAGVLLSQAADEGKRFAIAARYGRPFDDVFDARAAVIRAALEV